ncbi:MAG: glycoside hydrolase family 3 C-terminal domain-containing protein [Eubacteriales bacterium]|nr:glycoside hydrolase family 3 C-terminal domain-containing protein [Eubacteriales bacterium]
MTAEKIKELIGRMPLAEKASLCSGKDFWHANGLERLGIPVTLLTDGPHGLRKQEDEYDELGIHEAIKAVCFPAGCAMASTFNRELLEEQGTRLGEECQAENVSVLLGPAMNIKRSPLCGRNFEYLSEDPYVSGELAAALVKGIQSKHVGTSPKHFAMNNQETRRMSVSVEADERTMREIYLSGFETVVKEAKPWTIMSAYNAINGTFSSSHEWLLDTVLRKEWGFDGYVVSDWGSMDRKVSSLKAGMNLEMPGDGGSNDHFIVNAVRNGELDEAVLDKRVEEILGIVFRFTEHWDENAVFDYEKDEAMSQKVAEEGMVLLKNEGVLPLSAQEKVAFIGKYAKKPRYQGGGSSHVNSRNVISALEAASEYPNIVFEQGFDDVDDAIDETMVEAAVRAAKAADKAVIFAGLPDSYESESYDRVHMRMPENQNHLIREVAKVQPNTIVLLHNGAPVEMPWVDEVKGILECYLGGQAVGNAQVNLLFGKVNPSGKLAESFPLRLQDNPSYLNFPGEKDKVSYREGVFVGYRYYDYREMDVLFPFGYGLSYTTFAYSNLQVDRKEMDDTETVTVTVDVTNTGALAGKECVQLYVADKESTLIRPRKELKGFEKIELAPGETKTVTFVLGKRAFAYWNTELHDWHVESGEFEILAGKSSRDIPCRESIFVKSTQTLPCTYTPDSTMGDIMSDPDLAEFVAGMMKNMASAGGAMGAHQNQEQSESQKEAVSAQMYASMAKYMPLRKLVGLSGGALTMEMAEGMCAQMNAIKKKLHGK